MTEETANKTTALKPGMLVKVHQKIKETNAKGEEKDRIQVFEGTIIATKHGQEAGGTFTVRKISNGVGVEKIFPVHSPMIDKVEVVKEYAVRRAKLNFLSDEKFKRKLEEKKA